jgi:hypothetical protein
MCGVHVRACAHAKQVGRKQQSPTHSVQHEVETHRKYKSERTAPPHGQHNGLAHGLSPAPNTSAVVTFRVVVFPKIQETAQCGKQILLSVCVTFGHVPFLQPHFSWSASVLSITIVSSPSCCHGPALVLVCALGAAVFARVWCHPLVHLWLWHMLVVSHKTKTNVAGREAS